VEEIAVPGESARSTGKPKQLTFPLEARSENRGVHRVREAVAHVGRTFIFDVHVELANAWCQQEVHDGAIVRKLPTRQHYLIWVFRIEFLQPSTSFIRGHNLPLMPLSIEAKSPFPFCSVPSSAIGQRR
jgi:hypothetical protein